MKYVIWVLLAALLLCGCAAPAIPTEVTQPAETLPAVCTFPVETTLPPDPLDLLLADMTLEQKVGQLFIGTPEQLTGGNTVTAMDDALAQALVRYPLGGIVLFAQNIQTPDQLTALTQALGNIPGIPLFIAVDEEGGPVARLGRNPAFHLPTYRNAAAVGASGDPQDALEMGRTIGAYLKEYGFNLDFAPVADVNTNPHNPVIGSRAFSSDPAAAAEMAEAFAAGLREQGICATFKHFPGHGDTAQDSHTGLPVVYKTLEELENCEFLPFRNAGNTDMVMIAHVALPNVTGDMTPATLSRQIVTEILKEKMGFEGLVVTDAMNMGAIVQTYGSGEAAVAALQAGCDLILIPKDLPEAFDAVLAALEDGRLTEEWLDKTVRKILEFKQTQGIL